VLIKWVIFLKLTPLIFLHLIVFKGLSLSHIHSHTVGLPGHLYNFLACDISPLLSLVLWPIAGLTPFSSREGRIVSKNIPLRKRKTKGECLESCLLNYWVWNFLCVTEISPGESVSGIMHDAVKIIWLTKRVDIPWFHLNEVILLTWEHTDSLKQMFRLTGSNSVLRLHILTVELLNCSVHATTA